MAGAVFELGVSCASLIKLDFPHSYLLTAQSDCVYEMGKGGGGGGVEVGRKASLLILHTKAVNKRKTYCRPACVQHFMSFCLLIVLWMHWPCNMSECGLVFVLTRNQV